MGRKRGCFSTPWTGPGGAGVRLRRASALEDAGGSWGGEQGVLPTPQGSPSGRRVPGGKRGRWRWPGESPTPRVTLPAAADAHAKGRLSPRSFPPRRGVLRPGVLRLTQPRVGCAGGCHGACLGGGVCAGNRGGEVGWLDAEEPVAAAAAAASFTLISGARFTWARCAHGPRLFLALCSHNARTQLLRKLPGAH